MYSTVMASMLDGISAIPVRVEVDISAGMPGFEMVGSLSPEVREARERVRTALGSSGIVLPSKHITVNLSPANIKKRGTGFDLPIAVALLVAMGKIPQSSVDGTVFAGELNLRGELLAINGVLPIVSDGVAAGAARFAVPADNVHEARLVRGEGIYGFETLEDVIAFLDDGYYVEPEIFATDGGRREQSVDFSEVNGQRFLRRVAEIAASGMHNMLMVGPPGAGKTMISERMATILPAMSEEERLELSKIYSVCGLLSRGGSLPKDRPFRSPHHTVTRIALTGGGISMKPGEISLAHNGVLFLDELTEFDRPTVETLRQPL
ncbi:MAG: ATP-binding protein, partial [Clostridiales bacterium]|nr:ATP-binding protein [Clostridiales bacterium]